MSLAPLASAAQLQVLELSAESPFTHQHLDQLRMLHHLRKMAVMRLRLNGLAYLLRTPHSLQRQEIHPISEIEDDDAAVLSLLPSLTKLAPTIVAAWPFSQLFLASAPSICARPNPSTSLLTSRPACHVALNSPI